MRIGDGSWEDGKQEIGVRNNDAFVLLLVL